MKSELCSLSFELQAHRVVLAACSDYFRAMFTDPMRERSQSDIQLPGTYLGMFKLGDGSLRVP